MQKNSFSLFLLLFFLIGVYCFIFGESGWIENKRLQKDEKRLINRIEDIEEENRKLSELYRRYENGDFYKDKAVIAGYIEDDEKLIFLKGREEYYKTSDKRRINDTKYTIGLEHIRIFWIIVSIMIVFFYFTKR
ncbi:MAG: hypothetical protein SVZ03_02305 [Spirochaetota bacterium]|nr:hypothetical protein [Spirochaetota bacterium]